MSVEWPKQEEPEEMYEAQPALVPLNRSDLMDFMVRWDKSEYPNDYIKDPEQSEFNMRKANTDIVDAICCTFGQVPQRDEVTVEDMAQIIYYKECELTGIPGDWNDSGDHCKSCYRQYAKAIHDRIYGGKK